MTQPPIILASNSPRRQQLLSQIGLVFEVIPGNVNEDFSIDLSPRNFAEHYATKKAKDVAKHYPDHLVIGADTIVVLNGQILGKPADESESYTMLSSLSGETHTVVTGVSLQWISKNIDIIFSENTLVTFNSLSSQEIHYYIDNYHPLDKAGSYGIQDWFAVCVNNIDGCFYNVMGFPLSAFYQQYKKITANDSP